MLYKAARVDILALLLILTEKFSVEIPHLSQTYSFLFLSNSVKSLTIFRHLVLPFHSTTHLMTSATDSPS